MDRVVALSEDLPAFSISVDEGVLRVAEAEALFSGSVQTNSAESAAGTESAAAADPVAGELTLEALPLGVLPVSRWQSDRGRAALSGTLSAEIRGALGSATTASAAGWVELAGAAIDHGTIPEEEVGPIDLRYEFSGTLDTAAPFVPARLARRIPGTALPAPIGAGAPEDAALRGELAIVEGTLTVGSVEIAFAPVLRGLNAPQGQLPVPAPARIDLRAELPETPLQEIVDAIPPALLGPLSSVSLDGTFSWQINLEAPLRALSWTRWEVQSRMEGFEIRDMSPTYDVRTLSEAFLYRIANEETGYRRVIRVPAAPPASGESSGARLLGPGARGGQADETYEYVPYEEIAPVFVDAVITSEDGNFFLHNGVSWHALTSAAERNIREGRIVMGGSTIPMQLAKNLFLSHDRRLSRIAAGARARGSGQPLRPGEP